MSVRNNQCKACPWKVSTVPDRDIPGGYDTLKHCKLKSTIAKEGVFDTGPILRIMACHESSPGAEQPCVGWLIHQLGPGNNIALRIQARDSRYDNLHTDGPQHVRFEDTLPKKRRKRRQP